MKTRAEKSASDYTPVQTKRAFEEVAGQIRDQISRGLLQTGDRLPTERELAEYFKLSRNTVREALRALEVSGILELRKGATGGAFVREAEGDAVVSGFADLFRLQKIKPEHLTESRIIIAAAVTRLACQRGTAEDLELLENNLSISEAAVKKRDVTKRVKINLEFHQLLAQATRNPLLIVLTNALNEIQTQLLQVLKPAPNEMIMPSRRRLLKYLLERDEKKAVAEMQSNLLALLKHYLSQRLSKSPGGQKIKRIK